MSQAINFFTFYLFIVANIQCFLPLKSSIITFVIVLFFSVYVVFMHIYVFQGQMELTECVNVWKQKSHVMAYFQDTVVKKPKDFLGRFFAGLEQHIFKELYIFCNICQVFSEIDCTASWAVEIYELVFCNSFTKIFHIEILNLSMFYLYCN